ncbi:MAG: hypothetical protein LBS70_10520 [Candidatus Accumulibacter sp.]|nr:hypothetical protein [Accumulibacter sp.]
MTFHKNILLAVALFSLSALSFSASSETSAVKRFAVVGEQVEHPIPKDWKFAWMDGNPEGSYIVEYIPEEEDINSWREGYLLIQRLPYPSKEIMAELAEKKVHVADVVIVNTQNSADKRCEGKFEKMSHRVNNFNGVYFSVSGSFCTKYGTAAPFGEGAFIAVAEGKDFLFLIQYGWRPKNADERDSNLKWRITPEQATKYLGAIKATTLCGGTDEPECKHKYVD